MFNNVVVSIITCTSKNSVIGIDGKIPWYYPKDLIFFKNGGILIVYNDITIKYYS